MKLTGWLKFSVGMFLVPAALSAQELTLETAQTQARQNYPLIRQTDLINQTAGLNIQNLSRGYLPQIAINGQVTHQSDVTRVNIPLPGVSISSLSPDQYKATADMSQVIFDGGIISNQKQLQRLNAEVETERNGVELYKLRERINQLYLGILLLDEQAKQVALVKADIETGIRKTEALVNNGVAFRSNLNSLQAELLKAEQRSIELRSSRKGLVETLELFTGKPLSTEIRLQMPLAVSTNAEIKRPEILFYEKQTNLIGQQKKLIFAKSLPKASLFGQGGYGRPGLNMLDNKADWFYIAGLRLNWNISNLYTSKRENALTDINARSVTLQKETFLLNTAAQLSQQKAEVEKIAALIETDKQIIALREKVKTAANAQLENQVISASDYIREVNAEDQARQALITHQLQLIQAQINYNTISGN